MNEESILNDIKNLAVSLQVIDKTYNEYAKSINHTYTELQILNLISEIELCTQKKIVDASFLPKQTVNNTINKFITHGIVIKNESVQRNKLITLTDYGNSYVRDCLSTIRSNEIKAMQTLSTDERNILLKILSRYAKNFNGLLITKKGGTQND